MPRGVPRAKAAHTESAPVEPQGEPLKAGYVWVRVTKAGEGKISTGEHISGMGDLTYAKGDRFQHPRPLAEQLEERHYVEIDD